jgi:hypothetical protein
MHNFSSKKHFNARYDSLKICAHCEHISPCSRRYVSTDRCSQCARIDANDFYHLCLSVVVFDSDFKICGKYASAGPRAIRCETWSDYVEGFSHVLPKVILPEYLYVSTFDPPPTNFKAAQASDSNCYINVHPCRKCGMLGIKNTRNRRCYKCGIS